MEVKWSRLPDKDANQQPSFVAQQLDGLGKAPRPLSTLFPTCEEAVSQHARPRGTSSPRHLYRGQRVPAFVKPASYSVKSGA